MFQNIVYSILLEQNENERYSLSFSYEKLFYWFMKNWKINSIDDLEKIINSKVSVLDDKKNIDDYYKTTIDIPKKNGTRKIFVVDKKNRMYFLQKKFRVNFLERILLSDRAFGFVKDQSYFEFLNEHTEYGKEKQFLRIDIKDFFGSISPDNVREVFEFYVDESEKDQILKYIKKIILYNDKLVQGTPTAPVVSNIVFRKLDIRIERYCNARGVVYSRYADDLLFSTEKENILNIQFIKTIASILQTQSFKINFDKVRFSKGYIAINGFVVGNDVRLSRKKIKKITGLLYYVEKNKIKKSTNIPKWLDKCNNSIQHLGYSIFSDIFDVFNTLSGSRSFLIQASRYSKDKDYLKRCVKIIKRIEIQLEKFNK